MLLVCNDLILSMDLEKEQLNQSKSNQEQAAQIQKLQLLLSHMNQNYTNGEPIQQFMKNYKVILAEVLDIKNQEEEESKIRQGYIDEFGPIKSENALASLNSFSQLDFEFQSKSNLHLSLQNQGTAQMEECKSFEKSPCFMTNSTNLQQVSSFPSSPIKHISLLGSFNEEKPKKSPLIFGKLKSLRSDTNLKTNTQIQSTNIFEQETPETKCTTFYSANESKENQLTLSSRNNSPQMFSTSNPLFFQQVNNYPNISDNIMDEEIPINQIEQMYESSPLVSSRKNIQMEQMQEQSPLVTSRKNTIEYFYQQQKQSQNQLQTIQPVIIPQQTGHLQTINQQLVNASVNQNFQQAHSAHQNIENMNSVQFQNQQPTIQLTNSINLIQSQNIQNPQIQQQYLQQQQLHSFQQLPLFQQQTVNSQQIPLGSHQQMQQTANSIKQNIVSQQQFDNSLQQAFGCQQQFGQQQVLNQQHLLPGQQQHLLQGQQQIQQFCKLSQNNMNEQQNFDTQILSQNGQNIYPFVINQQNKQNLFQNENGKIIDMFNKTNLQQNDIQNNNTQQQQQISQQQQSIFNTLKNYKLPIVAQRQNKQNALHQLFSRVSPQRSASQQKSNQNSLNSSEIQNISQNQLQILNSQPSNTNQLKNIIGLPTSPENQQQSFQRVVPKSCISLFPSQSNPKCAQNLNTVQNYNNNGISLASQKNSINNSMNLETTQTVGISLMCVSNGNANNNNNKKFNNDKMINNFFNNNNNNNSSTYNLAQTVMLHLQSNNGNNILNSDQTKGNTVNYQNNQNQGNNLNYLKNQNNDNNYSQYLIPRMQPDQQNQQQHNIGQARRSVSKNLEAGIQNQVKTIYGQRLSKQQNSINPKLLVENDNYNNDSIINNITLTKSISNKQNTSNTNITKIQKPTINQLNNNSNLNQYFVNNTSNLSSSTKNGNVQNNAFNSTITRNSQPSLIQPSTGLRFQRQQMNNYPLTNNQSKTLTNTQNNSLNNSFKSNAFNGRNQFGGQGTHRISTNINNNNN